MHQTAQICTDIFKNFSAVIPPDPQNWRGVRPYTYRPPSARVHRGTYSELPCPLVCINIVDKFQAEFKCTTDTNHKTSLYTSHSETSG